MVHFWPLDAMVTRVSLEWSDHSSALQGTSDTRQHYFKVLPSTQVKI